MPVNSETMTTNADPPPPPATTTTKTDHHDPRDGALRNGGAPSRKDDPPGQKDTRCGLGGPCRLPCLQRFAHPLAFTLVLSLYYFSSTVFGPFFVSQVTSIERQFRLNSTQIGGLMAANDVGFLLLVLVVAHFGKHYHVPRILALSSVVFGLAAVGVAAANFLQPRSLKDLSTHGSQNGSKQDRYLCLNPNDQRNDRTSACDGGGGGGGGGSEQEGEGNSLYVVIFMGVLFGIQGVAKATRMPLGMSYIDDNIPDRAKTAFYVGILLTIMLFGPPSGFAMGGVINGIPVDLSDTTITSGDPRWISAWWLGILFNGLLCLLVGLPLLCFPKRLPLLSPAAAAAAAAAPQEDPQDSQDDSQDDSNHLDKTNEDDTKHQTPNHHNHHHHHHHPSTTPTILNGPTQRKTREAETPPDPHDHANPETHAQEHTPVVESSADSPAHETSSSDSGTPQQKPTEDVSADGKDVKAESAMQVSQGKFDKKLSRAEGEIESVTPKQDPQKSSFSSVLRDLPPSLCRLLSNPVYMVMILMLSVKIFTIVGFNSFFIKFLQHQFDMEPQIASYVIGLSNLVFNGVGTFVGGLLTTRVLKTRRQCFLYILLAQGTSIIFTSITLLLGCDNRDMVGLQDNDVVTSDAMTQCQCDVSEFLPVCAGNQTFLSPCHAGCVRALNATHFSGCKLSSVDTVGVGVCSPGCDNMIPFIVVQMAASTFRSSCVSAIYINIIRSVSDQDKALGLGLQSFAMSLLGFIPGPIAFGAVMDTACLLWSESCGRPGACALYDVTQLRFRVLGLEVCGYVVAFSLTCLGFWGLLWQLRTGRIQDDKLVPENNVEVALKDDSNDKEEGTKSKFSETTHF